MAAKTPKSDALAKVLAEVCEGARTQIKKAIDATPQEQDKDGKDIPKVLSPEQQKNAVRRAWDRYPTQMLVDALIADVEATVLEG